MPMTVSFQKRGEFILRFGEENQVNQVNSSFLLNELEIEFMDSNSEVLETVQNSLGSTVTFQNVANGNYFINVKTAPDGIVRIKVPVTVISNNLNITEILLAYTVFRRSFNIHVKNSSEQSFEGMQTQLKLSVDGESRSLNLFSNPGTFRYFSSKLDPEAQIYYTQLVGNQTKLFPQLKVDMNLIPDLELIYKGL